MVNILNTLISTGIVLFVVAYFISKSKIKKKDTILLGLMAGGAIFYAFFLIFIV